MIEVNGMLKIFSCSDERYKPKYRNCIVSDAIASDAIADRNCIHAIAKGILKLYLNFKRAMSTD